MSEYLVRWEMVFDADSFREAAEKALAVHRNPESIAVVFEVFEGPTSDCGHGTIDLLEDE
jgi:hypothetical protein